jgi:hypothetical protein
MDSILNACLKKAKCEIFDLLFFTLINPVLVGNLGTRKKFIFKIEADVPYFVLLMHAVSAQENSLRMLSVR